MSIYGPSGSAEVIDLTSYATKAFVESKVAGVGDMNMRNHRVRNLASPADPHDAATKQYVDSTSSVRGLRELVFNHGVTIRESSVLRDGSQAMTGSLNMGNQRIVHVADPSSEQDVATKAYVDSMLRDPAGNIDVGEKRVVRVGNPVSPHDAATKSYVDAHRTKPVITVWAEETTGLNRGQYEWSFGNGSDGRDHQRSGYTMMAHGRIIRMGLCSGTTTEDLVVNVTVNGDDTSYGVRRERGAVSAYNIFPTPLEVRAGSVINFVSRVTARLAASSIVALLIELDL